MSLPGLAREPRVVAVTRRRRAFGLDAPRPPDLRRTEAAILEWIGARTPRILVFRAEDPEDGTAPPRASTLVLVLPGGRIAILRVEITAEPGARTLALADRCRTRSVPLALVADVPEARAALRRLGVEPEEA